MRPILTKNNNNNPLPFKELPFMAERLIYTMAIFNSSLIQSILKIIHIIKRSLSTELTKLAF